MSKPLVRLVSFTFWNPDFMVDEELPIGLLSPEGPMAYTARVSSSNQSNQEYERLLTYCIHKGHWSVFEMADATMEVITSRAIAAQILRHRSFQFQEFCISGDSLITTVAPTGQSRQFPIETLFKRQRWKQYAKLKARVYDEQTQSFTTAAIKEVFSTGIKPCYKLTFSDGKQIVCTKEHKFLTKDGWESAEVALGITLIGKTATMSSSRKHLAVNGDICYQNRDWLVKAKEAAIENGTGVLGIAQQAGVSYHTIRKWLKKFDLSFSKPEVASYTEIWNKGKSGYKNAKWSEDAKKRKRENTPKGAAHHSYKGGAASERKAIANYFGPIRQDIFRQFNYTCQLCFTSFSSIPGRVELHHVKSVAEYPELAKEISNVVPVHRSCHMKYHGASEFFKKMTSKTRGNKLVPRYTWVESIEYMGEVATYDLEVDHPSHNYVANKICVHNSQRYAPVTQDCQFSEARLQHPTNRQSSLSCEDSTIKTWWELTMKASSERAFANYEEALRLGIAKEQARMLLPLATTTKLFMKGSLRSWIHYLTSRLDPATQLEHRQVAVAIHGILKEKYPIVMKAAAMVYPQFLLD